MSLPRPVFLCVVALFASALHAQSPAGSRLHLLKLTVVDAATNQPVAGAAITMSGSTEKAAPLLTDATGTATLMVPLDIPYPERHTNFDIGVDAADYALRRVMWSASAGRVHETLPAEYTVQLVPGVRAGGVVRDDKGRPVAGARISLYGSNAKPRRTGGDTKMSQQYASVSASDTTGPLTDAEGAWSLDRFPADLAHLNLVVTRLGGGRTNFGAYRDPGMRSPREVPVDFAALQAGTAVLTVKEGVTVRGRVVDEAGSPVAGAQLRARNAAGRDRPFEFTSNADGGFELVNWDAANVLISAEREGYRGTTVTIPAGADAAPGKIVLTAAQPLRLRLLGTDDVPLAGAQIQTDPNPTNQILNWKATTDESGRVVWSTAPDAPVTLWLSPKDYPHRTLKVQADGSEHVVRFRQGTDRSIRVSLRVVDAASGVPVPGFEVWRRMPGGSTAPKPWGEAAASGEFVKELPAGDFPPSFIPGYRLQVRAAGYAAWSSDTLNFAEGDQDITVKLAKGDTARVTEPPRVRRPGEGISLETPGVPALAVLVGGLLETGDVTAFVKAANATADDWQALLPAGSLPGHPLGSDPARVVDRRAQALTATATRVLEQARRAGLEPGRVRFDVKTAESPQTSYSIIKSGSDSLRVPTAMALRIVLTAEPKPGAGGEKWRGEYELSLSQAKQLPRGWSCEGVRWVAMPAGVADEETARELRLTNLVTGETMSDQRMLSAADDPALAAFGEVFAALLRGQDVPKFTEAAGLRPGELPGDAADKHKEMVGKIAAALLEFSGRIGANFSDARVTVKQIVAGPVSTSRFGDISRIDARDVRIVLEVESTRAASSGQSLAGRYTIATDRAFRLNGRWVPASPTARWHELPAGLLAAAEAKAVALDNYVAEHGALPPGQAAPAVEFMKLADGTKTSLASYRGKVVVLEFWASWCGPCQEPMEKLQWLMESNPAWKDRVEVIALSIDDKAAEASGHLEKKGWTKTLNVWAGDGAFKSPPAAAFRVRGIPTSYVIGRDGAIVGSGHPWSMDFPALVEKALAAAPDGVPVTGSGPE